VTPASYNRMKRIIDLSMAIPAAILSLPLQAALAAAVAVKLGRPVLFKQIRPGLHGKPFVLVKFRTMLPREPALGRTDDSSRLTPFGRGLRSTSLDELPTLWNVVRGDVSLVGPRPLLVQYVDLYSDEQARRHDVLPGLTGLAQVAGRNSLSWERKLQLDVEYVDRRSLKLDIAILVATVAAVLSRRGVSAPGNATMPEFVGNDRRGQP
jgi:lipopolysaccharide/colanic/teichoic acid biosynthesis glycosyltransferase